MTISGIRRGELKRILEDLRREVQKGADAWRTELRNHTRDNTLGQVDDDIHKGIALALIQMKDETLRKIDDCLTHLEKNVYGNCFDCTEEISVSRLRALPFVVRCNGCEHEREIAEQRERERAHLRTTHF